MFDTVKFSRQSKIDSAGRIVLPIELRNRLGVKKGDAVILEEAGDEVRLISVQQARRNAKAYFQSLGSSGTRWSDELLAERREESRRE